MKYMALLMVLLIIAAPVVMADSDDSADQEDDSTDSQERTTVRIESRAGVELRERQREDDIRTRVRTENTEIRTRVRADQARTEIRDRVRVELRERLDALPPALARELAQRDDVESVLERARTQAASEIEFRQRVVGEEVRTRVRERIQEAREEFEIRIRSYDDDRREFLRLRADFENCETECDNKRAELHQAAKASLTRALDALEKHVEEARARADESEDVTEEEYAEIVAKLDAVDLRIDELREALASAEDGSDVRVVAQEIGNLIERIKMRVREQSLSSKGGNIISSTKKAEVLERRLECTVASGADVDTTAYEAAVAEARALLEAAREARQAGDVDESVELLNQAEDALKKARDEFDLLREELRSQNIELEDCQVTVIDEDFDDDSDDELEIEVEFEDGIAKVKVEMGESENEYSLETTDQDEVIAEIAAREGLTEEEVRAVIEFEIELDEEERGDDSDDELEIEVEVDGNTAFVEIQMDDAKEQYELETTDEAVIIADISERTGLSEEEIRAVIKFEYEDESEDESEDDSDEDSENSDLDDDEEDEQ